MGFKLSIFICTVLIGLASSTPTLAGGKARIDPKTIPNAEDLIKHCWDISEEKRSTPNTAVMREGNLDTALCLRQEVTNQTSALVADTPVTQKEAKRLIMELYKAYARFYWIIYNDNKGCDPFCGTENHIRHNWEMAKLYEKVLTDVIELRKKYGV